MAVQMKGPVRLHAEQSQNFHTNNGEKVIHPAEVGKPSINGGHPDDQA
jgi:hypothetical protein